MIILLVPLSLRVSRRINQPTRVIQNLNLNQLRQGLLSSKPGNTVILSGGLNVTGKEGVREMVDIIYESFLNFCMKDKPV